MGTSPNKRFNIVSSRWFEPRSISSSYSVIVRVTDVSITRASKSGPLKLIGQCSHDGIQSLVGFDPSIVVG